MNNYCMRCGSKVSAIVPAGDNRVRDVCQQCGHIHYDNPRLVVGCLATWEDKILLCKRAIEPRKGFWTLPAGFMENGESTAEAAARETEEEAGAQIIIDAPFAMISIAHINQVHLFYRGHMRSNKHAAGEESLATMLVSEHQIPWEELSFRSVRLCLEYFLADRAAGAFNFHEHALQPI